MKDSGTAENDRFNLHVDRWRVYCYGAAGSRRILSLLETSNAISFRCIQREARSTFSGEILFPILSVNVFISLCVIDSRMLFIVKSSPERLSTTG